MTEFVLRPLLKSDFAAVVALWRGPVAACEDGDGADAAAAAALVAATGRAEQALLNALAAERTVVVAELDDRIAGFVVVDLAAARLDRLAVASAAVAAGTEIVLAAAARTLTGWAAGAAASQGGGWGPGEIALAGAA